MKTADSTVSAVPASPAAQASTGSLLLRVVLVLVVAALGWRVTVVNLADHFAQAGDADSARQALTWHGGQPTARLNLALDGVARGRPEARALLDAAADANPVSGLSYAAIAVLAERSGDEAAARKAMEAAARFAPQRTDLSLLAFDFWLRRGDVARALDAASVALTRDGKVRSELFPKVLALTSRPGADAAFEKLLSRPLTWWPAFFRFATERARDIDTLRALFGMQRVGPNETGDDELRAYLARLQREGLWLEAYLVWLNSVSRERTAFSGEVFNGGFEEVSRNLGFEWIAQPVQGVLVGFDPSYGVSGSRALHVVFQGLRARWRHFYQYLMLPPGGYILRGKVRVDSLQTERGVQWQVACLEAAEPLAVSERFKGTDQWRHFATGFEVPQGGCPVQVLRLELVGKAALDFEASGQIWFDDISVMRN
jgi:hypothetical protein